MLQAVFLVRATNDPILKERSNQALVFGSLIASIFNVANKFNLMDKLGVAEEAKSLKPKRQCPGCVHPWYLMRIMWRFAHIMCRFAVLSLCWIVLGGAPFGIYIAITFCGGCCFLWCSALCSDSCFFDLWDYMEWEQFLATSALGSVAMPLPITKVIPFMYGSKWIENCLLLIIITIFASVKFDSPLAPDATLRQMSENSSILALVVIGWVSWFIDVFFFIILKKEKIILEEPKTFPESIKAF